MIMSTIHIDDTQGTLLKITLGNVKEWPINHNLQHLGDKALVYKEWLRLMGEWLRLMGDALTGVTLHLMLYF